jgi:hypothetical protein
MSATKQQSGGVIPPHIITFEGKLTNTELSDKAIDELRFYAESNGFDLEAECLTRYGYGSEWLTRAQDSEISRAIIAYREAKLAHKLKHHHTCFECGRQTLCFAEKCKDEAEDECRECHEGTGWIIKRQPTF